MKPQDLSQAQSPDLRASFAALQRAAALARQVAVQTNTAIVVVVESGQLIRISAKTLAQQKSREPVYDLPVVPITPPRWPMQGDD